MNALDPARMSVASAAALLSRASGDEVTEADIRADIDSGAPTNSDGTLNVVHYAAWLAREAGRGDS